MLFQDTAPNNRIGIAGPVSLLLILVTLMLLAGERMAWLEAWYYDFLQRQQQTSGSDRIVLVNTNPNIAGGELWEVTQFPKVVEKLNAAGAALIVPVQSPPANSPLPDFKQIKALVELEQRARKTGKVVVADGDISLADQLAGFREQYEHRAAIVSAVKDAGNIVLAISGNGARQSGISSTADGCGAHAVSPENDTTPWVNPARDELNLPDELCKGAVNAGYSEYWPDDDGVVRRSHLLVKSGSQIFPSLALAVAESQKPDKKLIVESANKIKLDDTEITTGPGFASLIRYYKTVTGKQTFDTISAADLMEGKTSADRLHNRIVLLGDLAIGTQLNYETPFGDKIAPAVLLATSLSNLLQKDFLTRPIWLDSAELAILVLVGMLILLTVPAMSRPHAALICLFLVCMLLATEAYLLIAHGVWVQLVTATLFAILSIGAIEAVRNYMARNHQVTVAPRNSADGAQFEDELDLSFSILRQQPATDETKQRLYSIAMTHGKRREFARAERVLMHLASLDADYRDVKEKLKKLSGARSKPGETSPVESTGSPPQAATATRNRRTLGRYQLEEVLGRGAMATVYVGRDPKIGRKVAIKTIALAEEFSDEDLEAAKEQFLREAQSAGRLNHPNIITIYDTGEDQNVAYLAMEYFDGVPMNLHAQANNLLPPNWVLELMARAADALHYAHGQNVVHRDIKPANLMYNAANDAMKITDFGIARLTDTSRTKTGIILGTPSYMSPEQLSASAVTGKSDLYSLGITIYQLLTGTTPFRSDSIPQLMEKILNEKHQPIRNLRGDVPVCVDEMLDIALAKDPEDRYPNGRAMALALRDCCSTFTG